MIIRDIYNIKDKLQLYLFPRKRMREVDQRSPDSYWDWVSKLCDRKSNN
jgi:hypothetical protein